MTIAKGALVNRNAFVFAATFFVLSCTGAQAAEMKDLVGKWRWQQYTIEVSQCRPDNVCAKVVAGPKNVGMEVFGAKLTAKDGMLFGQIVHPETKDSYNTRFQQKNA